MLNFFNIHHHKNPLLTKPTKSFFTLILINIQGRSHMILVYTIVTLAEFTLNFILTFKSPLVVVLLLLPPVVFDILFG